MANKKLIRHDALRNYEAVRALYERRDFAFFEGAYNLNIFGVRAANRDQAGDCFDDLIGVAYTDDDSARTVAVFPATTDPGVTHMTDPVFAAAKANGTAILKEGQYRSAYVLGMHGRGNWRHRALQQVRPVVVYRDNNRDTQLDMISYATSEGLFGINIHGASLWGEAERIGAYSAGCQVIKKGDDLRRLTTLCGRQIELRGWNSFTYTLFLQEWL